MRKPKVGDEVVITRREHGHGFKLGETVTITGFTAYGYECTNGVERWAIEDTEFSHVEQEPQWGDPVCVRDSDGEDWIPAIFVGKDPVHGGHIVMAKGPSGWHDPEWHDQCKLATTVTRQEIADWKGVPVELLNIEGE